MPLTSPTKRQHVLLGGLVLSLIIAGLHYQYRLEVGAFLFRTVFAAPQQTADDIANAELAMRIGGHYFNLRGSGEYDLVQAQRYFTRALAIDPYVPDAWHNLARIDFLHGNFEDALYKIDKQIELHGDAVIASYYIRGLIYGYMGRYKRAEENFRVFLELTPGNWAALNDMAWVYFQGGQYEKTFSASLEGLVVEPDNPWLLNMHGLALFNLGRPDEARAFFEKAYAYTVLLSEEDWHRAYPGNNPAVAAQGLLEMRKAIERNITLASVSVNN